MDEVSIYSFTAWRYKAPYERYNLPFPPKKEDLQYFLKLENGFYCIFDEDSDLVAFCSFGPDGQVPGGDYRAEAVDIGLGVRPDLDRARGRGITL